MSTKPDQARKSIKSRLGFGLLIVTVSAICIGLVCNSATRTSRALSTFLLLMLVVVHPTVGILTADQYRRSSSPKLFLYLRHFVGLLAIATWGLLAVIRNRSDLASIGFRVVPAGLFFDWAVLIIFVGFLGIGLLALLASWKLLPMPPDEIDPLTPRTTQQKLLAGLVLAPTIGVCEEFLYRGFVLSELTGRLHSLTLAFLLSSVAFGVWHAYQGTIGIIRASMIGALLAFPVIAVGSLYPSMALHSAYDALVFVWILPRKLRRQHRHERS